MSDIFDYPHYSRALQIIEYSRVGRVQHTDGGRKKIAEKSPQ